MKKLWQKRSVKIEVAGIVFFIFFTMNKNKQILAIPMVENVMKDYQFNLITINTVFAGFSFTVLGILISLASTEMMQRLKETTILIKQCENIADSIAMFIISSISSLWFITGMYSTGMYRLCARIKIEKLHSYIVEMLYTFEIGYLMYGILLFIVSVRGMVILMKKIFEIDIKNGENKAKRFLKAAENQKDNLKKYQEQNYVDGTFKNE